MKTLTFLILVSFLAACGPDLSKCNGATLEPDIRYSGNLRGSAVDADGKLKPGNYTISTTYIQMKPGAAASSLFQQVMDGINKAIPNTPGLVAYQLSTSTECVSARTLSVWDDEVAMGKFVAGEAHAKAVKEANAISRGGGGVTHWTDTEAGATWAKAAEKVAADIRPGF